MFNLQIIYSTRTAYHITKIATAFFEENKMLKTMHPLNLTEITFLLTILTSAKKRTFLAVFIHVCLDTKRDCKN